MTMNQAADQATTVGAPQHAQSDADDSAELRVLIRRIAVRIRRVVFGGIADRPALLDTAGEVGCPAEEAGAEMASLEADVHLLAECFTAASIRMECRLRH
jgi:hypothetical protein